MTNEIGRWQAEETSQSARTHENLAVAMLRLGMAVNAIRSSQHFFEAVVDKDSPGGERDRLQAVVIVGAFVKEAVVTVSQHMAIVREWATRGGVADQTLYQFGQIQSGKHPASVIVHRLRAELGFHWDCEHAREWLRSHSEESLVWVDALSSTNAETLYRAASDAVAGRILPETVALTREETERRMTEALGHLRDAMVCVMSVAERAVRGYLDEYGTVRHSTK